jgi:hypothetical protein
MAWGDPASWSTAADELSKLIPAYTATKLLERANFAQGLWDRIPVNPLAEHNGLTATFPRLADMEPVAFSTNLTEGVNAAAVDLASGAHTVTVCEKGSVVAVSSLAEKTTIQATVQAVGDVVSSWAANSMEMWIQCLVSSFCQLVRVDADSTYEGNSVMTTGAGRTVITDTSSTTNHWTTNSLAGGTMTITDPYCNVYGESCLIASNIQDTSITVDSNVTGWSTTGTSGFSAAPIRAGLGTSVGVKYHVCVPTGIAAGDVLTLDGIRLAQSAIRNALGYGPGRELPGGGYNLVMDSQSEAELQASLISAFAYKANESVQRDYPDGKRVGGCLPTLTAIPFRTAVGGDATYAAGGAVKYNQIFSPLAFQRLPIQGSDIGVIAKGKATIGGPMERFSTTEWHFTGAGDVRNGAWAVSLLTFGK